MNCDSARQYPSWKIRQITTLENNSESHANEESEFRVRFQNITSCFNCLSMSIKHAQNMIFKLVESSKSIGFLFGMWTIFLRKTLTCRIFVSSAPLDLLVSWRARTSAMTGNHHVSEIQDFHFLEPQNAIFKGLELKTVHFLGILGIQPSQNLAEWFGRLRLSRKIW